VGENDWKSCIPQKGIEGSNPSFSAIKITPTLWVGVIPLTEGFEPSKCNTPVECCRRRLDGGDH